MSRENNKKKVYQYDLNGDFVRSFGTMSEASVATNTTLPSISRCCSGKQKYAKGFTYRKEYLGDKIDLDDSTPPVIPENSIPLTKINNLRSSKSRDIHCIDVDGCWEVVSHSSKGSTEFDEYPRIRFQGVSWKLSRLVHVVYNEEELIDGKYVMHTCDNPKCVNPEHLTQGTPKDNHKDMVAKNRESDPPVNNKLTSEEVLKILESNEEPNALAGYFGVGVNNIYAIKTGKLWGSVTGKRYIPKEPLLTESEVIDIYRSPHSCKYLAEKYGTSYSYVYNIKTGRSRTDITKELN